MCGSKPYCSCGCNASSLRGRHDRGNLGLTATTKRAIKPGYEYDKYFAPALGEPVELGSGNQKKTLKLMREWVKKHQHQTKKIAEQLKRKNLVNTLSAIWHFLYEHVQYELDQDGVEQLRTPNRVWADRFKGVDCDCYSIFISSFLHNLGIPHAFRMTKYSGDWQHVYVVVPKDGTEQGLQHRPDYFVIDPVADRFNYEHQFSAKHDLFMNIRIQGLQGFGSTEEACQKPRQFLYEDTAFIERMGNVVTAKVLDEKNIVFEESINEQGAPVIKVPDGTGNYTMLPTVITQEEAATITAAIDGGASEPIQKAGIGKGWIWALIAIAGGIAVFSGSKPTNKAASTSNNLSGAPKRKRKRKTVRRKKTPITI